MFAGSLGPVPRVSFSIRFERGDVVLTEIGHRLDCSSCVVIRGRVVVYLVTARGEGEERG